MSSKALIDSAHRHLGRPWCNHGFDCWELVRAVYYDAFHITLPVVQVDSSDTGEVCKIIRTFPGWLTIKVPVDGCVVTMGKRDWPHHVGVYLAEGGGMIAHCVEHIGVCIDRVSTLKTQGWGFMAFYKMEDK